MRFVWLTTYVQDKPWALTSTVGIDTHKYSKPDRSCLLTHEDAVANRCCRLLVEEENGSSMKTIAFMTITFSQQRSLQPSLRYHYCNGVKSKLSKTGFGYWAFMIPAIIVIFVD